MDECPSCRRHFAANANAFEQTRQLQVSGSMEEYRRAPSPESALQAHGQLLAFRDFEQADEFRRTVLDRFSAHARLRAGLASQLDQFAVHEPATKLFQEALAWEPDMPEARVGVARRRMATGELDAARRLLDYLETPGAGQEHELGPIDVLSGYYQRAGCHEEALSLAEHLLREVPAVGQRHAFRAFVRKSEKALGRRDSILPPIEHAALGLLKGSDSPYSPWQRRLLWVGLALALLACGLLINNEYIRRHRTVHIVNACGQPVEVGIDDGPATSVTGLGKLSVSEGRHRVRLSGPVEETLDFNVTSSYFDRWFKSPVWIINPGGEAVLDEMNLYYAQNPQPSSHRLIAGQSLVNFAAIDYPFEDPPPSLDIGSKSRVVAKTALRWIQGQDKQAFAHLLGVNRKEAMEFAERRLRRSPDQRPLLFEYVQQIQVDAARIEAFLKSGLDRRPVSVQWHRFYQSLCEYGNHDQDLPAIYDRYLSAEPGNGALLFLRGRIESDWNRRMDFYRRAIDADARLPWPWMAMGAQASAEARWDESLQALRKAKELGLDDEDLRDFPHLARMAKGEASTLVNEYRSRVAVNPMDFTAMIYLCDALAVSGQSDRVMPEVTAWASRLPGPVQAQLSGPTRAIALYQTGKIEECEKLCSSVPLLQHSTLRAQALMALRKGKEVGVDTAYEKCWDDPWTALALCLAVSLEGQPEQAAKWRDRVIKKLEASPSLIRPAAKFLSSAKPPPLAEVARLQIESGDKALLYLVLGDRFPANRAEYQAAATRYNVLRMPPYILVNRAIHEARASSP